MKIAELDEKAQDKLHQLSGLMNMPNIYEFESLEHLLSEVMNRVSQASSLSKQISKILHGR